MKAALFAIILILIFSALFYVRIIPAINNDVEFKLDCSFNYRMTSEVVNNGNVPAIDKLSTYPDGKEVNKLLPTGMYYAAAIFHKFINRFKSVDLNHSILLFCSLCGALICIPIYFISYGLYRNRVSALLSAFLAGIIPAYLNRSVCYWYRYETAAVPVLFFSLLFLIKAFGAQSRVKTSIYSLASTFLLIISLYIWRLSSLFLVVYTITLLYLWMRDNKCFKGKMSVIFTVCGIYIILLLFIPGFGFKSPSSNASSFPAATIKVFLNRIGIRQNFDEFTQLVNGVTELNGVSPTEMFGWMYLSLSGIFAIVYIFMYIKRKGRDAGRDILFVFLTFFLVLTFIFSRNKAVLGPIVAVTLGESIELVLKDKRVVVKNVIFCVICLILLKTGYDAYRLIATRHVNTKIEPRLKESLAAINKLVPEDAVMLSYWADGYLIQTYCLRPTVTDGLFESPEIVKRIAATARMLYSYSEDDLWNFCKSYGVTHVLVPTYRKTAFADDGAINYRSYYRKNSPTELGKLTTMYKLIYAPKSSDKFDIIYANKEFRLYRVK